METLPEFVAVNRVLWDSKTAAHINSDFYNLPGFMAGESSLKEIELELLGDVRGKSILHLQCHFGQDTLSLARMGARVMGVDLSEAAITKARELNDTLGLDAAFVCSDIYSLPGVLLQQFDIVFTSYGTIVWLPDLDKWAGVISNFLKPGGRFVFADFHPLVMMYDDDFTGIKYPYFNRGLVEETESGTYADRDADIHLVSHTWNHSFAETLQALLDAGLMLTKFREYDYSPYSAFGNMTEFSPGRFRANIMGDNAPLVYALEARKGA